MPTATSISYRTVLITLLIAISAFAFACGGSDGDDESPDDGGQTSSQQDSNSGNGSGNGGSDNSGNGSDNGSDPGDNGGPGDLFGLGANSGEEACDAITTVAGIPGSALAAIGTDEAATEFGKDAQDFFIDVLEDALDTDVNTACIFDAAESDGDSGVWMTFSHGAAVGSGTQAAIESAAESAGASVVVGGSFFGGFGGFDFASVSLSSLPFGGQDAGAVIFIAEGSIVATAGSDFDLDDVDPFEGGTNNGGGGQADPTATPITVAPGFGGGIDAGGLSGDIAAELESALLTALDIELELESTAAFGTNQIAATVSFDVTSLESSDVLAGFEAVVESFGGIVNGSFSFGNSATVQFQGASIGGLTVASGTLTFSDGQIVAVISGAQ